MKKSLPYIALVTTSLVCNSMKAGVIVVPNSLASAEGDVMVNIPVRNQGNPRTYQMQISASELSLVPTGSSISGLAFRLDGGQADSAPSVGINFADYEITLAQAANSIASISTTFSLNMSNPVMVRDGLLSIVRLLSARCYSPTFVRTYHRFR
jgi:hypothetical protein